MTEDPRQFDLRAGRADDTHTAVRPFELATFIATKLEKGDSNPVAATRLGILRARLHTSFTWEMRRRSSFPTHPASTRRRWSLVPSATRTIKWRLNAENSHVAHLNVQAQIFV